MKSTSRKVPGQGLHLGGPVRLLRVPLHSPLCSFSAEPNREEGPQIWVRVSTGNVLMFVCVTPGRTCLRMGHRRPRPRGTVPYSGSGLPPAPGTSVPSWFFQKIPCELVLVTIVCVRKP